MKNNELMNVFVQLDILLQYTKSQYNLYDIY